MSQDTSKTQKTIKLRIMEILDPATDGDKASQICTNFIVFWCWLILLLLF